MFPKKIMVLNPGSTSTKVSIFENETQVFKHTIDHQADALAAFHGIIEQLPYRRNSICSALAAAGYKIEEMDAYAAICTGLPPMPGGIYEVNEALYEQACSSDGSEHPGKLGPLLAREFAQAAKVRAFIMDPSSTDEFCDEARVTGFHEILRTSRGHPLNQRAVARKYADSIKREYEELNLVVIHLGGGISVSAHCKGKMIDTIDSTCGEGRMAPTRTGMLPAAPLVKLCFSGKYSEEALLEKIEKTGGWTDLLGTSDGKEVKERVNKGERAAELVFNATAYQIAKDIAACAAVLSGQVDAVIFTGGLSHWTEFVEKISDRIRFIAPIHVFPGEMEMEALAEGAMRVLEGKCEPQRYPASPVVFEFNELIKMAEKKK